MARLYPGFTLVLASLIGESASAATITTVYLQQASDRYQHTIDVYSDADAAGNHFAARGEFDFLSSALVPAMDEISSGAPCFGITCITATFEPTLVPFGGWYFLNGTLGPTQGAPSANWGDVANAGYDLSGATALQFWARGKTGGEVVQFFAFGVGRTTPPFQPFPDSSSRAALFPVALTTTWTRYQIPLAGRDIHYVLGGFGWVATAQGQASPSQPITFYLDNIQYVKDRLADPRFLVSYETIRSSNAFDQVERNAAFVYDNAVALIALIAAGDMGRARTIADAMVYAQLNDRFFSDGRLRNAYQGGDIALPPGWTPNNRLNTVRMPGWYDVGRSAWFEDESQVSTTTGNVAWAMLSLP